MDSVEHIEKIALARAVKLDKEGSIRFVLRWYSKTFHTPLHIVAEEIPLDDVWLAYFEEHFANMEPNDLDRAVELALEPPEDRAKREDKAAVNKADDDAFLEKTRKQAQEAAAKPQVPVIAKVSEPVPVPEGIEMTFIDPAEMERLINGDIQ